MQEDAGGCEIVFTIYAGNVKFMIYYTAGSINMQEDVG